jgi:hypothetical protein
MARLGDYRLSDKNFPNRIQRHRKEYPDTAVLESVAAELARDGFPTASCLRFLRQVCRWGGYYGIAARVRNQNAPTQIAAAFKRAARLSNEGDVLAGLAAINTLRGLGRPSFASKFVRFLAPQSAPILDAVVSQGTGFPLNALGYGQLIAACQTVAEQLQAAKISNPIRQDGVWYLADIEAAFYADMEKFEA